MRVKERGIRKGMGLRRYGYSAGSRPFPMREKFGRLDGR